MNEESRQDTTIQIPDADTVPEMPNAETSSAIEETADTAEAYGWEFHKLPLAIAAVLTLIFYAFVFFYVHY